MAPPLLDDDATHRRQKEIAVSQQKQMFKLLSPMKRKDGGTWWLRAGTGFRNQDNSINIFLDALPLQAGGECRFQLRAYDEDDLRKADERRGDPAAGALAAASPPRSPAGVGTDSVPF